MSLLKIKSIHILTLITLSSCLSGQNSQESIEYQNLKRIDGTRISADTLKNKILVVNFWATWCKPCLNEIPDLNQLVLDNKDKDNILFLAIATSERDHPARLSDFFKKVPFLFEHLAPESGVVFYPEVEELRYPTTLIYDASGTLQKKFVGTLTKKELKKIRNCF